MKCYWLCTSAKATQSLCPLHGYMYMYMYLYMYLYLNRYYYDYYNLVSRSVYITDWI